MKSPAICSIAARPTEGAPRDSDATRGASYELLPAHPAASRGDYERFAIIARTDQVDIDLQWLPPEVL